MQLDLVPAQAAADILAPVKQLVLDAVSSPHTKAMYKVALDGFQRWWERAGQPPFNRATVQAYRSSGASVNQKLSAIRKLAMEATYAGLLDATVAQGIQDVKGANVQGVRTGNWLTKTETERLLGAPGRET